MRIALIILLLLFISALVIISNNNLHLKYKGEAKEFGGLYYSWLLSTSKNIIKTTGYIVKFDLLSSQNISSLSNSTK